VVPPFEMKNPPLHAVPVLLLTTILPIHPSRIYDSPHGHVYKYVVMIRLDCTLVFRFAYNISVFSKHILYNLLTNLLRTYVIFPLHTAELCAINILFFDHKAPCGCLSLCDCVLDFSFVCDTTRLHVVGVSRFLEKI
jgi:hypothetical protein